MCSWFTEKTKPKKKKKWHRHTIIVREGKCRELSTRTTKGQKRNCAVAAESSSSGDGDGDTSVKQAKHLAVNSNDGLHCALPSTCVVLCFNSYRDAPKEIEANPQKRPITNSQCRCYHLHHSVMITRKFILKTVHIFFLVLSVLSFSTHKNTHTYTFTAVYWICFLVELTKCYSCKKKFQLFFSSIQHQLYHYIFCHRSFHTSTMLPCVNR